MRFFFTLCCLCLGLSGCASLNTLTSEVATFGPWPAERKPGSYVFERLPSQNANLAWQQRLEAAARPALEAAGFKPAAEGASAEFTVQLGSHVNANERSRADPFMGWQSIPRPYPGRPGWRPYYGYGWMPGPLEAPSYERSVKVLIRDVKRGQTVFEATAVNDGPSAQLQGLLPAMFEAALKDFPNVPPTPRRVTVQLPP